MDASRIAAVEAMQVAGDEAYGRLNFDAYTAHQETLAWIVEDRNLNRALNSALQFAPQLQVVQGKARRFAAEEKLARIELEDGSELTADLVIGADGAHSWLRSQCDIGIDYRAYGQQGVVCNFECEKPHHGVAYQWFVAEQGIIALLPLPGNRVSLVWSAPDPLAQILLRESMAELIQRLAVYSEPVLGALTPVLPEAIKAFPLTLIKPHAITAPRVALIGDAAHVVHPLAGHGMNLGFGDVQNLLSVLKQKEDYRDCGDPKLLARYQRSRKEDVLLMQLATDGLQRLFGSDLEPLKLVRNLGLNVLERLPGLKRRMISQALGSGL
jgi:2-octaprenylphenol hydroxylase